MRAVALPTFGDGRVRINVDGREASGIVPREEYKRVRKEIVDLLLAAKDPRTGLRAISDIEMASEDPLDVAPTQCDIEVYWSDAIDSIEHPEAGKIGPFRLGRTGGHTGRGFVLMDPPSVGTRKDQHLAIELPGL